MRKIKLFVLRVFRKLSQNYVPRSVILLIDAFIVFLALQLTFFLIDTVQPSIDSLVHFFDFSKELFILFGIQLVYFFVFNSYAGIVRYTGFKDAFRQLQTTLFTVVTALIINQILFQFNGVKLIVDAGVIIYGFIAFSSLYFFRIVVKRAYQLIQSSKSTSNAYILGTELTDVAIAESIISDTQKKFEIVGFISENNKPKKTKIFTLPIYSLEQLSYNVKKGSCVIVSAEKLQKLTNTNSKLINQLLELNLKVYKLPELQNWDDKSISSGIKKVNLEDLLQRSPIKLSKGKLRSLYESRVVLVTGAGGSIGSDIVRQLIPFEPKKIILLDQAETPLHHMSVFLDKEHPEINYEKVIADVTNVHRLQYVFENYAPEVVFHGAAYKHVPMMEANPIEALMVNYLGTKNLVDLSQKHKVKRFVFVSTDKAVNPTNIMGASKRSAEIYVQSASRNRLNTTAFITTRFGNVLGSNGSVIPHFKRQIESGGPVTVTHPEITRFFMTIDEACQLVLEAGAMGKGGEIFVFDMGKPIKIVDLAKQMIRLSGYVPNEDIDIVFSGLRPGEKLYEELLADKENTQPTHHQKILIAKSSFEFDTENYQLIEDLTEGIKACQTQKAIKILKAIVPEYKPASISVTSKVVG
ncbi:polysaccharide biosynthesis protein [Psychroflexus planctonicus]|uniref:polysaccharide biosynthesis protein n=1 Tax=Psychroflexus planctonicus TaxID=1526575 RepID=UPI001E4B8961|nr:nucleoside-diphosphate sugar epimerase/dehydratase [Psychroflexus planctonicus]